MPEFVASTVEGVNSAIAGIVRVAPAELQERVGTIVVTTSDKLKTGEAYEDASGSAMVLHDGACRATIFLADRIPAGQEAWAFVSGTVLPAMREGAPADWGALLGHLRGWGSKVDDRHDVRRVILDTAVARVAYARMRGSQTEDSLLAFAVEAAVQRGVLPDDKAKYGSAQAWLAEVVSDMKRTADQLFGNDLPGLDADGIAAFVSHRKYHPEAAATVDVAAVKAPQPKSRQELYQEAKAVADGLWAKSKATSEALNEFIDSHGRGAMGLTPDSVKALPEYQRLNAEDAAAMRAMQQFNKTFVKEFAKERRADRENRFAAMPPPVVKQSREEILEARVAVLTRQLHEAREALDAMVTPSNSGKDWLSSCEKYETVSEVVGGVLDGPQSMIDALWEIKALAERHAAIQEGSGKCSPWEILELAEQGLVSGVGSAQAKDALSKLVQEANRSIEEEPGEWMPAADVAKAVDQVIFEGVELKLQGSMERRVDADFSAPGM